MANVCLVRPPFFKIYGIEKTHFPLSIGYLASYLEKEGHRVSFVDGEALNYNLYNGFLHNSLINAIIFYTDPYLIDKRIDIVSQIMKDKNHTVWNILTENIAQTKPDIIGITCYTVNMTAVNILAEKIKLKLGDIPIALGGIHPTSVPEKTLREVECADYIIIGEGEGTFLALVNNISKKGQLNICIEGVLNRKNHYFKQRTLIQELDSIPFPKRNFYNKSNYVFGAPLLTSRGCLYKCTFCASHLIWDRKVRYRSVSNVIEELKALKAKFDIKRIRIVDDTFISNKRWIIDFCSFLKKDNLKFTFNCSGRINTIDEELLEVLYDNGFDSISFGIESGSEYIIKKINKEINLSSVVSSIKLANKYGFDTTSFYITGHPGETQKDIRMSQELFKRSKSKRGELSMLVPYPGTEIGEEAQMAGLKFNIDDYYKFYHARNRVLFNMTRLSDKDLLAEHARFQNIIKRRNYCTLFKKIIKLAIYFLRRRLL